MMMMMMSKTTPPPFAQGLDLPLDSYVIRSNLSTEATLGTEESGCCREVTIMASLAINVWEHEGSMICTLYIFYIVFIVDHFISSTFQPSDILECNMF